MKKKIRKLPPVCLFIALFRLVSGKLRLSSLYHNAYIDLNDRGTFSVFRHIRIHPLCQDSGNCVFIVIFKFSSLSHRANKLASIIPMLLIAGFPGFIQKIYAVNTKTGYWQGMYQWKSVEDLHAYQQSFVFKMMQKRAGGNSIEMMEFFYTSISNLAKQRKIIKFKYDLGTVRKDPIMIRELETKI